MVTIKCPCRHVIGEFVPFDDYGELGIVCPKCRQVVILNSTTICGMANDPDFVQKELEVARTPRAILIDESGDEPFAVPFGNESDAFPLYKETLLRVFREKYNLDRGMPKYDRLAKATDAADFKLFLFLQDFAEVRLIEEGEESNAKYETIGQPNGVKIPRS